MRRLHADEAGSVGIWMLGLGLTLLTLGGISFDLWNLLAERRELAAMADAAAVAAASGVDVANWRLTGDVALDPALAGELALASIGSQPDGGQVFLGSGWFEAAGATATVRVERDVDLMLLRLIRSEPITVRAVGRSEAELRP